MFDPTLAVRREHCRSPCIAKEAWLYHFKELHLQSYTVAWLKLKFQVLSMIMKALHGMLLGYICEKKLVLYCLEPDNIIYE